MSSDSSTDSPSGKNFPNYGRKPEANETKEAVWIEYSEIKFEAVEAAKICGVKHQKEGNYHGGGSEGIIQKTLGSFPVSLWLRTRQDMPKVKLH